MTTITEDTDLLCVEETLDSRADLDAHTLYEIDEDIKLRIVLSFKNTIAKEPEFCGIYSLSSYNILDAFENFDSVNLRHRRISDEQFKIFKSTYCEIYDKIPDELYIHKIAFGIMDSIYV